MAGDQGGNSTRSASSVVFFVVLSLLVLSLGFSVSGDAASIPFHETVDHYQGSDGDWYVLQSRDCGFGCEDIARIHVYGAEWEEKSVVSIPAPNASGYTPRVSAFAPTEDGWWLERENGSFVRATSEGIEPESRRQEAPTGFHSADQRVSNQAIEVDTEISEGSISNVYRGEDGFLWALSTAGQIYQYTAYGQYTGNSHEAGYGTGNVSPYGLVALVAFVVGGVVLLVSLSPVAWILRQEAHKRGALTGEYAGFAVLSYVNAYLFLWYPLDPPIARIYWLPDRVLAAGMVSIVAVEALAVVRPRRGSIRWFDLPYLAIANNAMLVAAWILVH